MCREVSAFVEIRADCLRQIPGITVNLDLKEPGLLDDAADIAAETLLSQGIFRLNGVILSHYDRDHAGGATNLLTRIDADVLYLPDCLDTDGYSAPLLAMENALLVDSNMEITFGDTKISLITTDYGFTNNESGLCVLFTVGKYDILITEESFFR